MTIYKISTTPKVKNILAVIISMIIPIVLSAFGGPVLGLVASFAATFFYNFIRNDSPSSELGAVLALFMCAGFAMGIENM